ncbi:MAG: PEP-CTERM sorting domain-containing protein [Phycisphaeraceae bacterium]
MNHRQRFGAVVVASTLFACASAQAATTSTFDDDLEGWTTSGDVVSFTHETSGGNPGGWGRIVDAASGATFFAHAPTGFHGDRSAADGTVMSFDFMLVSRSGSDLAPFGTVTISSSSDSASLDFGDVPATGVWQTYSAPLTAADWGKTQTEWDALLSDVTDVQLRLEAIFGNETVGLDNFVFVPEPGSAALLALGGVMLLRRRRA